MTAPCTLLQPLLLLAIIACSSAQYPDSTAYPIDGKDPLPSGKVDGKPPVAAWSPTAKPPTGSCGNIAEEWEVLKHHVMSLHGQGAALDVLSNHVRELGEYMKHLTERGESGQ